MCKYCEKGKYIEERAGDNIFLEIYGKHLRVIGRVLGIPLGRDIIIEYCPMCRKEAGRVKRYASGYWYQFIIPRRLTLPPTRIYRWLNFFWRLKDKEVANDKRNLNLIIKTI